MRLLLAIPAGALAVTVWCAHGLEVTPAVFLLAWVGLTSAGALLWRGWLAEVFR